MNYAFYNKSAIVYNMSSGNSEYQQVLSGLSIKELKILQKHTDLIEKVREITKMSLAEMLGKLAREYDLEMDQYQDGNFFISIEKIEDGIPRWFKTNHAGWYKESEEMKAWAQDLLMQEVRINIWIRYCEYKTEKASSNNVFTAYGQYL